VSPETEPQMPEALRHEVTALLTRLILADLQKNPPFPQAETS
jgi:hypothetical protein